VHVNGVKVLIMTYILDLMMSKPSKEFRVDMVTGYAHRFEVPMRYGGPRVCFLNTLLEYKRIMPKRIIRVSVDSNGKQDP